MLAGELTSEEMRRLLADMKPDDRTQFLAELPGQVTQTPEFVVPGRSD